MVEKRERGREDWVKALASPVKDTTANVQNLTEGQFYEFRVVAFNTAGQRPHQLVYQQQLFLCLSICLSVAFNMAGQPPHWLVYRQQLFLCLSICLSTRQVSALTGLYINNNCCFVCPFVYQHGSSAPSLACISTTTVPLSVYLSIHRIQHGRSAPSPACILYFFLSICLSVLRSIYLSGYVPVCLSSCLLSFIRLTL